MLGCAVLAGLLSGCGGASHPPGDLIGGRRLTVYVSLPLGGASRVQGEAALRGARLALAEHGGHVGRLTIGLQALDDSTPQLGKWDPGQTSANAHLALSDPTTVAYLGELNSGASAISIPLLARPGIPQLSPASAAVGLTSGGVGASPGEPQKYYPTGIRTFVRVAPNDAVQAAAQVALQRAAGCTGTLVFDDGEVDDEDISTSFSLAAQRAGLRVLGVETFNPAATDYTALAAAAGGTGADCLLISATTDTNAVALTEALAQALPKARLFGAAGLAESTYVDAHQGGVSAALDSRMVITSPALGAAALPTPGRRFLQDYTARFGKPQPAAIFGYEAMRLLLDAISRSTAAGRHAARRSSVRSAIFGTRSRPGAVGLYSITASGETTLRRYGAYHVVDGRLRFWRALDL